MTDAAYVIGGWVLTAGVLGGYAARIAAKSRRARKVIPPEERPPWT